MAWERDPFNIPDEYPTIIVFQGKQEGEGLRPLALILSLFRFWGRVRQCEMRAWEAQHRTPFFWGSRDKECD
eukprot:3893448-Pyramimonas_sp.AAC.1